MTPGEGAANKKVKGLSGKGPLLRQGQRKKSCNQKVKGFVAWGY
jgi:hypothetical protein